MTMDETEILEKTFMNMKQVDEFYGGPEFQSLLDISIAGPLQERKVAEVILNHVDLIDASIEFFTDKKEWQRCYGESTELVSFLRDCIDDKYKPE